MNATNLMVIKIMAFIVFETVFQDIYISSKNRICMNFICNLNTFFKEVII